LPETAPLLVIQDLCKTFVVRAGFGRHAGTVEAVHNLNLSLGYGGSLAIVGESGSGKTTTARIIIGLETATDGVVMLDGQELTARANTSERRRRARLAQIVFQNPYASLDPRQSAQDAVEELLSFHLAVRGSDRTNKARQILQSVGVNEREALRKPRELSGGQCQRVAIARALAVEPKLLVLDEAVSALDVSVQAQILNLLADLREEFGVALLFITHDLAVVNQVADQVMVMYRGRAVEEGNARVLLSEPAHPYTRRLLESAPEPTAPVPQPSPMFEDVNHGCRFRTRCSHAYDACVQEPDLLGVTDQHTARCWLVTDSNSVSRRRMLRSAPEGRP
jgi:oligopeptide transport system ATP-binding protein